MAVVQDRVPVRGARGGAGAAVPGAGNIAGAMAPQGEAPGGAG